MGGGDLIRGGGEGARNCLLVKLQRGKTFIICNACAFNPSFIQCVGGVTTIAGYSYLTKATHDAPTRYEIGLSSKLKFMAF